MSDKVNFSNLKDRDYLMSLHKVAIDSSHSVNNVWKRAYEDLAYAADRLDALIARTEIQGPSPTMESVEVLKTAEDDNLVFCNSVEDNRSEVKSNLEMASQIQRDLRSIAKRFYFNCSDTDPTHGRFWMISQEFFGFDTPLLRRPPCLFYQADVTHFLTGVAGVVRLSKGSIQFESSDGNSIVAEVTKDAL